VFDAPLRELTERALVPLVRPVRNVSPMVVTAWSLGACVGAGVAAWRGLVAMSVVLWLLGRILDGIDGTIARGRGIASELGGYLDLMADVIGYAVVPIGIVAAKQSKHLWMWCAILLATFYVNTLSWTLLSALAERRDRQDQSAVTTTFTMPTALIEGAETIVLFTLMLALPRYAQPLFIAMSVGVAVSIVQRVAWAVRNLN
jgi:phosphatidylglycerophosphate synthase